MDGVENRFTQRPSPKPWVGCVGSGFERCLGGSNQCVGQENTNYVYGFVNGRLLLARVNRRLPIYRVRISSRILELDFSI